MLPIVSLAQRDTIRMISAGHLKAPVLEPLASDNRELDDLTSLESATNPRLRAQQAGLPGLASGELVFGRQGDAIINAAFTHTRPDGNRFNDESRGAWYCAFEIETALQEVAFHLTRALEDVGRYDNVTDYAALRADFIGPFHNLRGIDPVPACLHPEPDIGYPSGQALARALRAAGSNGIVYPSVRRRGGTCLAAFHPRLVQNLRQGAVWRLAWQGTREPVINRITA